MAHAGIVRRLALALMAGALGTAAAAADSRPDAGVIPGCDVDCTRVITFGLGEGASLTAWRGSTPGGVPHSWLQYSRDGGVRSVTRPETLPFDRIETLNCDPEVTRDRSRATGVHCVATFVTGMHSSGATLLRVDGRGRISLLDSVEASAPGGAVVDLDQDGPLDVALLDSTYEPDFATGPVFWRTWVQRDGEFLPTGCTTPVHGPVAVPTTPATGYCPYPA